MSAIRFHCIYCGAKNTSGGNLGERLIECPECRHIIPVPSLEDGADGLAMIALSLGVLELEMKFLCVSCGVKLGIDARWEGRSIQCPKCKTVVEIPRWSRRREPAPDTVLTADEVAFLSADGDPDRRLQSA